MIRRNVTDDFESFYQFIISHTLDEIIRLSVMEILLRNGRGADIHSNPKELSAFAKQLGIGCFQTPFIGSATVYDFIVDLKKHADIYKWAYDSLSDLKSKETFFGILKYRFFLDKKELDKIRVSPMQYFLPELLPAKENAVLVDCGAFNGDTVKDFISVYNEYKRIYFYEPSPENYQVCCNALSGIPDILPRNKGVSDVQDQLSFTSHMPDAANRLNPGGDVKVQVTTLDLDISEPITFLKMDVEGAEQAALDGAQNHIVNDHPQLAICLYHTIQDIWMIPMKIHQMNPNYKFYIRYHDDGNLIPEEFVLYGKPMGPREQFLEERQSFQQEFINLFESGYEAADYLKECFQSEKIHVKTCITVLKDLELLLQKMINSAIESEYLHLPNHINTVFSATEAYLTVCKDHLQKHCWEKAKSVFLFQFYTLLDHLYNELYAHIVLLSDPEALRAYYKEEFSRLDEIRAAAAYNDQEDYKYKVSIIVTAQNQLEYTQKCIESLFEYTPGYGTEWELILKSDGSTDGTEEYFNSLKCEKTFVFKSVIGLDDPCIYAAEGKYICCFSNDIIASDGWLDSLLACLESDEKIGMVSPSCKWVYDNSQAAGILENDYNAVVEKTKAVKKGSSSPWLDAARLVTPVFAVRSHMLKKIGWSDYCFHEDYLRADDITMRIARAGYRLVSCENSVVYNGQYIAVKEGSDYRKKGSRDFYQKYGIVSTSCLVKDE